MQQGIIDKKHPWKKEKTLSNTDIVFQNVREKNWWFSSPEMLVRKDSHHPKSSAGQFVLQFLRGAHWFDVRLWDQCLHVEKPQKWQPSCCCCSCSCSCCCCCCALARQHKGIHIYVYTVHIFDWSKSSDSKHLISCTWNQKQLVKNGCLVTTISYVKIWFIIQLIAQPFINAWPSGSR